MASTGVVVETIKAGCDTGFDWAAWDRFVDACPGGTFYHRSGWLAALSLGLRHDIRLHVLREGGQIRAGAFFRRATRFGVCAGRKPWGTGYNGLIAESGQASHHARALGAELLRIYQQVRLVQAPEPGDAAKLPPPWHTKLRRTPVLDLRDMGKLWDSFDRRARQRVRKAAALGVSAGESTRFGDFAQLYMLTYERQSLKVPMAAGQIEGGLRRVVGSGDARLFLARTALGEPAAGLLVGIQSSLAATEQNTASQPSTLEGGATGERPGGGAGRGWFALAASHPLHRKSDAVTFLWWYAMEQCAGVVGEIDLVGHGVGSIDQFKRSFSPNYVEHIDCEAYGKGAAAWALRALDQRRKQGQRPEIPQ